MHITNFYFEPGDIVLISNNGLFPSLISKFTNSKWTHAVIYVGYFQGHDMFIESGLLGVNYTTLDRFRGMDYCVLRSSLSLNTINLTMGDIRFNLGKKYDYKGLLGYMLYKWKKITFQDPAELFCSELIVSSFNKCGDLFNEKPLSVWSPDDIYTYDKLKVLYEARL